MARLAIRLAIFEVLDERMNALSSSQTGLEALLTRASSIEERICPRRPFPNE